MESSTIMKNQKILEWVNLVSIYRPRSSGHLASSKRFSGGFFITKSRENTFSHESQQFCMMVRSGRSIKIIFVFLERFAWSCKISFHFSLSMLQPKPILFHFAWSCEIEKHVFSTPLCNFSRFFIFNLFPPPSIQLQSLVQTNYITSFIVYLDHRQLYLLSSIWFISFDTNLSKSYLEMAPKLHKTCK